MKRRRLPKAALLLAGVALLFAVGLVRLFELRFAVGDVYPAYSTLRADPLGTKALYDSLAELPGLRVERNLRPLHRLLQGAPAPSAAAGARPAVFYLGADAFSWPFIFSRDDTERLDAILQSGGQLVISFVSSTTQLTTQRIERDRREQREQEDENSRSPSPSPATGKDKGKDKDANEDPTRERKPPDAFPGRKPRMRQPLGSLPEDLAQRWQVDFRRVNESAKPSRQPPLATGFAVPVAADAGGEKVAWHTALDFDLDRRALNAGWRALYTREGKPVVIARNVGAAGGRIILASDSYFLSNEALRDNPSPTLLAALPGPARRLIFDETHFGVKENPGLMTLARRFRLEWALGAAGLLAALFIWKSMVSLVPLAVAAGATRDDEEAAAEPGRDSAAGFLNLVRRGVPARDLLAACLAQWQASGGGGGGGGSGKLSSNAAAESRLRAIVEAEATKPLRRRALAESYREMCQVVKKR